MLWIAVSESLISRVFDMDNTKTLFYLGSTLTPTRTFVLDSSLDYSSAWTGGEENLYSCTAIISPAGSTAVIWSRQRIYLSDIVLPHMLGKPLLQCSAAEADSLRKILQVENADHPTALCDEQGLIHLAFESVLPFRSTELYDPYRDTSFYFVTSDLRYRLLHPDGRMDSLADFHGGFRPEIHRSKSGTIHLFWLKGDSSNSAEFQLMYSRNPGAADGNTVEVQHSLRAVEEYRLNRYPPSFRSFVDDSGRAFVGWTDAGDYNDGRIYFAKLLSGNRWDIDTLAGLPLWGTHAEFRVEASGMAHVLWQTYDGSPGWLLHYAASSPSGHLFAQSRTFRSPYAYAEAPVIVIDSRGVPNALFTDGPSGIGYLRDLEDGVDTVLHVSPGSSIASAIGSFPWSRSLESSVMIDRSDQIFLVRSHNGLAFLKFDRTLTGQNEIVSSLPKWFSLEQNFPNPFNPRTIVSYEVPASTDVNLTVYDLLGRQVAILVNERKAPGRHESAFDASGLASGVYLCRLAAGGFVQTRKMILAK
jgi:hypothetical protein